MTKFLIPAILALTAAPAFAMGSGPSIPPDPAGGPVPILEYNRLVNLEAPVPRKLDATGFGLTADAQFTRDYNELLNQMLIAKLAQAAPNRGRFNTAADRVKVLVPSLCTRMGGC